MGQYLANKITSILPISSATMDEVLIARRPHFSDADGGVLSYTYQQDNIVNQVFELRSPSSSRCAWPTERTVVFDLGLKWPSLITYDLMYDFSAAFRTAAITIYQATILLHTNSCQVRVASHHTFFCSTALVYTKHQHRILPSTKTFFFVKRID